MRAWSTFGLGDSDCFDADRIAAAISFAIDNMGACTEDR